MKKVLFAAFCFGCLTATTAFAQTGESKGASESAVSPTFTPSNARGKTPSKGSPLLQRTTGEAPGVNTPAPANATKSAPVAPSQQVRLRDSIAPVKSTQPVAPAVKGGSATTPR